MTMNILDKFYEVKVFVFDVDGVLTDGTMLLTEDGRLLRQFNARDGYALRKAVEAGFRVAIITRGKSEGVATSLRNLGVTDIYTGVMDKLDVYMELLTIHAINPETVLYMGDDIPDVAVMRRVGLPTCPDDATPEVKSISKYVSPIIGGRGCVRDVIEKTLKLQNKWYDDDTL
jgi:3-deoxy-D-manno-octulosonate 8-phosphate phosphatase (KDO 8-P phosphatase)